MRIGEVDRFARLGEAQQDRSPAQIGAALLAAAFESGHITFSAMVRRAANSRQTVEPVTITDIVNEACRAGRGFAVKKALTQLPGFDPNATGSDGRLPLAAAVDAGDTRFVRHLLCAGADPARCLDRLGRDTDRHGMVSLLRAAKTINSLLPAQEGNSVAPPDTNLMQALRSYDLRRAQSLLEREGRTRKLATASELWVFAVRANREDLQCAILVTASSETMRKLTMATRPDAHSALHRLMNEVNPEMRAHLKQEPYRSLRHGFPTYNNGTATFFDSGGQILCRHLSAHWLRERMISGAWKRDYSELSSTAAISAGIESGIQASYVAFMNRSPEVHMIHVDDWGKFLAERLEAMGSRAASSPDPLRQRFFVNTSNHAMVLELKIKARDDGTKAYSALLYDPNETNTHKRASCTDLHTASRWTFNSFLVVPRAQQTYLLEKVPLLMAFSVPDNHPALKEDFGASAPGAEPNRRLASGRIAPCRELVFHLLRGGFGGELRARKEEILAHLQSLSPADAASVLDARDGRRIPGLFVACQEDHHDAIAAFGEILMASNLSSEDKARVLDCRRRGNPPGMYVALALGHARSVAALGRIIARAGLPPDDTAALFAARFGRTETPGLVAALAKGHKDSVDAFRACVYRSNLTEAQRVDLMWHVWEAAAQR